MADQNSEVKNKYTWNAESSFTFITHGSNTTTTTKQYSTKDQCDCTLLDPRRLGGKKNPVEYNSREQGNVTVSCAFGTTRRGLKMCLRLSWLVAPRKYVISDDGKL
ncbi:hypothetical protein CC1G_15753 [Coprinopsis cinerea okayama7|uniref:Uncharacterized protein n=1 Tax=Coprinopsis cinerea (strain Okayama-7 / 130 / ATCC MYA-4618 / FGSC 9003) TaxID=240176 RepID=D6RR12_COPC7|nr:hypothetical protein CC1G_15753 [Coprinopsis cinerea okayama7\|eukprot:XP_002910034.1 hypothetical protein CC1G_15753 [Coprinopsis cinerea okayama7\